MDKEYRIMKMSDRQRALELLQQREQQQLNTALQGWQAFFANQPSQEPSEKQTLRLRQD